MNMQSNITLQWSRRFLVLIVALMAFPASSMALQSEATVKARVKARYPVIRVLIDQGKVGETYEGYVATVDPSFDLEQTSFLGQTMTIAALLAADKTDRESLYDAIAQRVGVVRLAVEQSSRRKLFARAKAGHWLRNHKGTWFQKTASVPG